MNGRDEFIKKLGNNIRKIRMDKNLSVEKLSLESGMAYSQISRIELGKRNPTAFTLYKISNSLNCSPTDFFDGIHVPQNNSISDIN
ncbi:MAG: hypothetical protein RL634_2102 [Bacteroidota bacterium]|jgi:transcriptional regulator with XRE-family HTH domain